MFHFTLANASFWNICSILLDRDTVSVKRDDVSG